MFEDLPQTWWRRNWKWIIPLAIVCHVATICIFTWIVMSSILSSMKESFPYQTAMAKVRADSAVSVALGQPIEDSFFFNGNISQRYDHSGEASFRIPISGPKGKGLLIIEAEKSAGLWSYTELRVHLAELNQDIELISKDDGWPRR